MLSIQEGEETRTIELLEDYYSLGRIKSCSIVINNEFVSRHHATIIKEKEPQTYSIIDGNLEGKRSTNGLFVNGEYTSDHRLKDGDLIEIENPQDKQYRIYLKYLVIPINIDDTFLKSNRGLNPSDSSELKIQRQIYTETIAKARDFFDELT